MWLKLLPCLSPLSPPELSCLIKPAGEKSFRKKVYTSRSLTVSWTFCCPSINSSLLPLPVLCTIRSHHQSIPLCQTWSAAFVLVLFSFFFPWVWIKTFPASPCDVDLISGFSHSPDRSCVCCVWALLAAKRALLRNTKGAKLEQHLYGFVWGSQRC